jgi:hypothetical protein
MGKRDWKNTAAAELKRIIPNPLKTSGHACQTHSHRSETKNALARFRPVFLAKNRRHERAQVCSAPDLVEADLFKYNEITKLRSRAVLRRAVV